MIEIKELLEHVPPCLYQRHQMLQISHPSGSVPEPAPGVYTFPPQGEIIKFTRREYIVKMKIYNNDSGKAEDTGEATEDRKTHKLDIAQCDREPDKGDNRDWYFQKPCPGIKEWTRVAEDVAESPGKDRGKYTRVKKKPF